MEMMKNYYTYIGTTTTYKYTKHKTFNINYNKIYMVSQFHQQIYAIPCTNIYFLDRMFRKCCVLDITLNLWETGMCCN